MKGLATLLIALTAWAAVDDDPIEVLVRVRDRVLAHAERVPNHTCVETVTRDSYDYVEVPAPKSCDALLGRRHQAGVAENAEMYSWPGAKRFESREVDEFVPPGAMGTGPFAAALLSVFELRDPKFVFEKETVLNGRRLMEYSFTVPEEQSRYKAKAGSQWLITGYTGTVLVDPLTADLAELNVRTEELPAATNLCEVDTTLEYGMVRLRGEDYLVPAVTRQRFIGQDGAEMENTVTFNACRDFRGESDVSFGVAPGSVESKAAAEAPLPLKLPEHMAVRVELTSTISVDQAAAGDRIEGRLAQPIRGQSSVLVPAGARVEGRLVRAGTAYRTRDQATIGLRWETVEVDGAPRPLFIVPEEKVTAGKKDGQPAFELAGKAEQRYAVYHFLGQHVVLKGLPASRWFTFEP